ncbi:DUF4488 domain-containing protein [Pedobacter frigoris]|uniref:DUF4488 domain-containing protein n=1 Tax=Pedobacter frigoris TaxID=2571272 RepID=UPI0029301A06|nr:DUF4488 domain-containing protein [Pedobacter frigoris]
MKLSIYLPLVIVAFLITAFTLKREAKNNRLKGIWQIGNRMTVDGKMLGPAQYIKIYEDSTFKSIAFTNNGAITFVEGTYKIVNDSLFNETVVTAINKAMQGKTNHFKYKINNDIMQMGGVVNASLGGKATLMEAWKKVGFPDTF